MSQAYEMMYILRPNLLDEQIKETVNKYHDLLAEQGATNITVKFWGKRRLAYPIAKHQEGVYILMYYQADGKQVAVLEKAMRFSEEVIRYLTLKIEELPQFSEETFQDFPKSITQPAPAVVEEQPTETLVEISDEVETEEDEQPSQPAPEIVEA